jgi:hypothetical protein
MTARWVWIAAAGGLITAAGCRPKAPAPAPVTAATAQNNQARRLMQEKRELEREVSNLRGRILELERSLNTSSADLAVERSRLADRLAELEAARRTHRRAGASTAAAEAITEQSKLGTEAVAYVQGLIDTAGEGGALDDEVDWAGFAGEMLSGGADAGGEEPIDPEQAAAFIEALPEEERAAALGEAREAFRNVMGGDSELWQLKPEVGNHYVLGKKVKVELLGRDADGRRQRFSVTVAKKNGKFAIVSIDRG